MGVTLRFTRTTPAASVLFGCEWRNSTGTSEAAFRDGTRWPALNGITTNGAASIQAGGVWLSQALRGNTFRMNNNGTTNLTVRHDTVLAAAQSHYGRVYFTDSRTTGTHNHWIAQGGLGTGAIQWAVGNITIGGVRRLQIYTRESVAGAVDVYPNIRWAPGLVDNATGYETLGTGAYCLEWHVNFVNTTDYRLSVWLNECDSNGIFTTNDKWTTATFICQDYNPAQGRVATLASIQDPGPSWRFTPADVAAASRQYVFGNEGAGGNATDAGFFEAASFGLSTTGRLRDSDLGLAA